ncbi:VOC family protein [Variovorax sp. H27-G14]|uniref:VOC family protein n=1 Tax=Variovorax sp. H27-G14 TaxID=3111914 RepID=UPI0038FCC436
MPKLDHLTVIAPSLEEGVAHIRSCLGVDIAFGRKHAHMGTHNHLLCLGDGIYLEVIAIDEDAPRIAGPRWFGLDDRAGVRKAWDAGKRLRGWVASTDHFERHMAEHASSYGERRQFQGGTSSYFFSVPMDGALPLDGVAPSLIDRQGQRPSLPPEAQRGCSLLSFAIEHPDAMKTEGLYRALNIVGSPAVVQAEVFRYTATIQTPAGVRVLT